MRIYGVVIGFVVLALLGNIAVVPLARGTKDWLAAALGQVAALLAWAQNHPWQTVAMAALLAALFALSVLANREVTREQQAAVDARSRAVASDTAAAQLDQKLPALTQEIAGRVAAEVKIDLAGDIQRAVAAGERASAAAPVVPSGVVSLSGLPRPATLVGRKRSLHDLMAGLRQGGAVSVFAVEGLAGVGKTALAAEAVAHLAQERATFPGGAAWVTCEGLAGAEGLAELWARVARALGAEAVAALANPEERRASLRAALADPARPRLLLALDNVEPGLDDGAVLDTLAGGRATLLLTSRGAVAPDRLQAFPLEPLADPAAVQLFTQRLHQADPTRPTPDDTLAIPTLAGLLGGLPLAIELAAAYTGIQRRPLEQVTVEVRHDGLAGGALRGVRPRFERSWGALTATQQRLFAGLSLLEGANFPRAAALAIARATTVGPSTSEAEESGEHEERAAADLDALIGLALVEPQVGERLRLHPLLREYAAQKLQTPPVNADAEQLGDAAVAYWLAYAQAHPDYAGMDALEAESPGIMGALAWAHDHSRHRDVLTLTRSLATYWDQRGRTDSERIVYPWAVEATQALHDEAAEQWALHQSAVTSAQAGRAEQARAGYEAALALARQLGDPRAEQAELHGLAVLEADAGRAEQARAGYEAALALARQLGDPRAEQAELHGLAVLEGQAGRAEQARAGYEAALALARQLGDPAAQSFELQSMGALDVDTQQWDRARVELAEALALARQVQQPARIVEAVWWLAELDGREERREAACAGFRAALEIYERLGNPDAEITRQRLRELGCEG